MSDGMSMGNLDSYLTQSDDATWDKRITDGRVRADALIELDLDENYVISIGDPAYGMEVEGEIDSVTASHDGKHWIVKLKNLEFPVLIPNDSDTWIDFA